MLTCAEVFDAEDVAPQKGLGRSNFASIRQFLTRIVAVASDVCEAIEHVKHCGQSHDRCHLSCGLCIVVVVVVVTVVVVEGCPEVGPSTEAVPQRIFAFWTTKARRELKRCRRDLVAPSLLRMECRPAAIAWDTKHHLHELQYETL